MNLELKNLRTALDDLKEDVLIDLPMLNEFNHPGTFNSSLQYFERLESLRSEEIERLCRFDKFDDEKPVDMESSLKESLESAYKIRYPSISVEDNEDRAKPGFDNSSVFSNFVNSSAKLSNVIDEEVEDKEISFQSSASDKKWKIPENHEKKAQKQEFTDIKILKHIKDIKYIKDISLKDLNPSKDQKNPHDSRLKTEQNPENSKKLFEFQEKNENTPQILKPGPDYQKDWSTSSPFTKISSDQNLLQEIESLRLENAMLRMQLHSSKTLKTAKTPNFLSGETRSKNLRKSRKSKTPKKNRENSKKNKNQSISRSKSRSLTPRETSAKSSRSPLRFKHCNICDHLLSKGYSTKYCSKHGVLTNK